ncbi:MAG: sporulation peptidase YabG [Clostridia bacterium]|nr:sporulation peptidase YabG [Clostridia bacterium]MDD4376085.1 sporulation peptidase YabG [Clostridia bacterium]
MNRLKVGDIVARRSYGYDVLFKVSNIYDDIADLIGITVRIIADAPIYDLKIMTDEEINKILKSHEDRNRLKINRCYQSVANRFNIRNESPKGGYSNVNLQQSRENRNISKGKYIQEAGANNAYGWRS